MQEAHSKLGTLLTDLSWQLSFDTRLPPSTIGCLDKMEKATWATSFKKMLREQLRDAVKTYYDNHIVQREREVLKSRCCCRSRRACLPAPSLLAC